MTMLKNLDKDARLGAKADRRYLVEAVENMHDLLTDVGSQQIRSDFARQLVRHGLIDTLEKLENHEDSDVRNAVADFRAELAPFEDARDGSTGTTQSRTDYGDSH